MIHLQTCPICQSRHFEAFIKTKAQMHPTEQLFNFDQCRDCQLVFLNPRVPMDELMDYYTDYYLPYRGASAWGKYKHLVEKSQAKLDKRRVALVSKYLPNLTEQSKVLDVGCGKPSFLKQLHDKYECRAHGIDFSDAGWKQSPNTFASLHLEVKEIQELSKEIQPDLISMWHYLEHDYKPYENLRYLRNLSHPGTYLIIEVPNVASDSRQKYGEFWAGWHTSRHTSLFSPSNLRGLLNDTGWKVLEVLNYGTLDPYLLYWMSEMEKRKISWSTSMEPRFLAFVVNMMLFAPKRWSKKSKSLGVMTAIATAN